MNTDQIYRTRHLVAREPFYYDGRTLREGERFSATPEHAMILEGLSKAQADDQNEPAPATSFDPSEDDTSPTAETIEAATEADEIDSPSDSEAARAEKNRKRRERQRRVLHTSGKAVD